MFVKSESYTVEEPIRSNTLGTTLPSWFSVKKVRLKSKAMGEVADLLPCHGITVFPVK